MSFLVRWRASGLMERNLVAMSLRMSGKTYKEIGDLLGVSQEQIRKQIAYFKSWGLHRVKFNSKAYKELNPHKEAQSLAQKMRHKREKEYQEKLKDTATWRIDDPYIWPHTYTKVEE